MSQTAAKETTVLAELWRESLRAWRESRVPIVITGVVLVVIGAIALFVWAGQQREAAAQTDGYYCTLSGVGPTDRAPETGKTCAEITG